MLRITIRNSPGGKTRRLEETISVPRAGKLEDALFSRRLAGGGWQAAGGRWQWVALLCLLAMVPALARQTPQASAAPAAKPPIKLTLTDAVAMAVRQNPQVQIAILNSAQSTEDKNIARSGLLPQVVAETSERRFRGNIETFLGHTIPGFPQHVGPIDVFSIGPNVSIPVFDLTLWRRYQAAQEGINASRAAERTTREQITLLVVSQYLGALRAAADRQAAQSRLELATALHQQAADLQRQGVGTGIDTLRANVEMQNERQRLIVSGVQLRTALYGLARLVNLDPAQDIELTDQVGFFATPPVETEASLAAARANRPELRVLDAQERIAALERQGAGESRFPSVRLGGNWAEQGLGPSSAIPTYTFQLTLDVPLFTGGRISAERQRAELQRKKIAAQRQDLLNQIALEVKTSVAGLEAARNEVNVASLGVTLATEEVQQARDRFNAGVANNIEVISAQDALARANDNQIAALYRYNQARAGLAYATGQIEKLYGK